MVAKQLLVEIVPAILVHFLVVKTVMNHRVEVLHLCNSFLVGTLVAQARMNGQTREDRRNGFSTISAEVLRLWRLNLALWRIPSQQEREGDAHHLSKSKPPVHRICPNCPLWNLFDGHLRR